jgi:selenocysteine lyase/cysteine desulfurase
MDFPVDELRARFPALALKDDGRRRVYLDNPAGTQVPQAVAEAVARCLIETNANLGGHFATTVAAGPSSTRRTRRWPTCSAPRGRRKSSSART